MEQNIEVTVRLPSSTPLRVLREMADAAGCDLRMVSQGGRSVYRLDPKETPAGVRRLSVVQAGGAK
ncbi:MULTISPECIES: hypothetical protein [unclassified Thioalkalivibrio]|uniref:hypothetical protein n=1 Tax=unclassified Thioalkalivibrio TaxID=2621013 RepID=UPI00035FE0BF|nr:MULTISPECIES: hypothetical protein [unclassified Thioalkalivibrio]